MTFSVLFTFTDFQLIYVLTRGGPLNATHLMATLSFQRAIPGGQLGEGAAIAVAMIPFLLAARSEEHTSELQSLMRISYAVFCLKKKIIQLNTLNNKYQTIPAHV